MNKWDNAFIEDIYRFKNSECYEILKNKIEKDILDSITKSTSEKDIQHMSGQKYIFEYIESIAKILENKS